MSHSPAELRMLETLFPTENGLTVFDAETQETSYGILFLEGRPYIYDTHRKQGHYVATIEILSEVVEPVEIGAEAVRRFCGQARTHGVLPIPYSGCFFKGNLHVYAFSGPVRGFDLAAIGDTALRSERRMKEHVEALRPCVPKALAAAQRELLGRKRPVRHAEDLEVLRRRARETAASHDIGRGRPRSL